MKFFIETRVLIKMRLLVIFGLLEKLLFSNTSLNQINHQLSMYPACILGANRNRIKHETMTEFKIQFVLTSSLQRDDNC